MVTADALGGVWRYATTLAGAWSADGIETVLAVLGPGPPARERAVAAAMPGLRLVETGLPLDWTAADAGALARAAEALAGLARAHAVDTVHLHAPALLGDAVWNVPVVATVHSCLRTWWAAMGGGATLPRALAWRDARAADGLGRADAVVAPSACFARDVARAYRLPAGRVVAIPNGCDVGPAVSRAPDASARVLCCGRLWDAAKDVATIEAAARRLPGVTVHAAGAVRGPNGEAAPPLRAVRALGTLDGAALADAMAAATVFVSAARYEPFGLAALEAAGSGLALVLADIPTARALWDGAATFFPPGDAAALAAAITEAAADAARRGGLARARARDYSTEAMAGATRAVHEDLLRTDT